MAITVPSIIAGISCAYKWDIPVKTNGRYVPSQEDSSKLFSIPEILLSDPTTAEPAHNCAVAANAYQSHANDNHVWAIVFGVLQVGGAGAGTVAASAAFENGAKATPAKISAVSFAVAAGIAALDQAYEPGKRSAHDQQVMLKISHLILLAAAQLAGGETDKARTSLSQCADPADVNDAKTVSDIEAIQAKINRMIVGHKDGGSDDGRPGN